MKTLFNSYRIRIIRGDFGAGFCLGGLHDSAYGQFQRALGIAQGGFLDGILNPVTIPPVFAANAMALGMPQAVENARLIDR